MDSCARMQRVGLFGWWMQLNHYGCYVEWHVTESLRGKERCMVAVERNGTPRVPSTASMMECMKAGFDLAAWLAAWLVCSRESLTRGPLGEGGGMLREVGGRMSEVGCGR